MVCGLARGEMPVLCTNCYVSVAELFGQSSLLENCIGSVPGFDMVVYDKTDISDRTVPYFVITFSLPFKPAISFPQMLLQESGVISIKFQHFGQSQSATSLPQRALLDRFVIHWP